MQHRGKASTSSIQQDEPIAHLTERSLGTEIENDQPEWSPHILRWCTVALANVVIYYGAATVACKKTQAIDRSWELKRHREEEGASNAE